MKRFLLALLSVILLFPNIGNCQKKISDYPLVTTPDTNAMFLIAVTNAPATNQAVKFSSLKSAILNESRATNLTLVNGAYTFGPKLNAVKGDNIIIAGSATPDQNGIYILSQSNFWNDGWSSYTLVWTNGVNGIAGAYDEDLIEEWFSFTNGAGASIFDTVMVNYPDTWYWPNTFTIGSGVTMRWTTNYPAIGTVFTGTLLGDGSLLTNLVFPAASMTQNGIATTNQVATINLNQRFRTGAAQIPRMGFVSGDLLGNTEVGAINIAKYLKRTGLVDAGYNTVCLDARWAKRSGGLPIFDPVLYPSGRESLFNAIRTNNCSLGLYCSLFPYFGELIVTEKTAYNDAKTMAKWGITFLKVDGGQQTSYINEEKTRHIGELLAAGLDDGVAEVNGAPIFLSFNSPTNRAWVANFANGHYSTQPVEDAVGNGDSANNTYHLACKSLYALLTNFPAATFPGLQVNPMNAGDGTGYSYWDTNCTRMLFGLHCIAAWTLLLGDGRLETEHSSHLTIWTNREAIQINQDLAVGSPLFLANNACTLTNNESQKILYRRMANGDIALGMWNWDTNNESLFVIDLRQLPYLQTNFARVFDVFNRTNSYVTDTLSSIVNTQGFNLYRISRY